MCPPLKARASERAVEPTLLGWRRVWNPGSHHRHGQVGGVRPECGSARPWVSLEGP